MFSKYLVYLKKDILYIRRSLFFITIYIVLLNYLNVQQQLFYIFTYFILSLELDWKLIAPEKPGVLKSVSLVNNKFEIYLSKLLSLCTFKLVIIFFSFIVLRYEFSVIYLLLNLILIVFQSIVDFAVILYFKLEISILLVIGISNSILIYILNVLQ